MVELIILPAYIICRLILWMINTVSWLSASNSFEISVEKLDDFFYYFRFPLAFLSGIIYYSVYIYFSAPK